MKTITFYSYKGGVGRTLALSNIATRLAELGKSVCIIDFDLEAPGVPHKFKNKLETMEFQTGLVDYLQHYIKYRLSPPNVVDFTVKVQDKITLIPAGNIYSKDYWTKLSSISWDKFFYEQNSTGVAFFFDLKEKIKEEIKPDYLLIDSRTGITEIAGITLSLLADEVVLLSVNNDESLDGTQQVLRTILQNSNPVLGKPPKIHFVMCRVPPKKKNETLDQGYKIAQKARQQINQFLQSKNIDYKVGNALVIHSEPDLQVKESLKIAYSDEETASVIGVDYLRLFEALTEGELSDAEISNFIRRKEYQKLKTRIILINGSLEKINFLEKALAEFRDLDELFILKQLGEQHYLLSHNEKAKEYLNLVVDLYPNDFDSQIIIAEILEDAGEYSKAIKLHLELLEKASLNKERLLCGLGSSYMGLGKTEKGIDIYEQLLSNYPPSAQNNNNFAHSLMKIGEYSKALIYSYKALELEPNNSVYNATLAEIYAYMGNDLEFYRNITIALSSGFSWTYIKKDPIYQKYLKEQKFLDLLARYNIFPNEEL